MFQLLLLTCCVHQLHTFHPHHSYIVHCFRSFDRSISMGFTGRGIKSSALSIVFRRIDDVNHGRNPGKNIILYGMVTE